MSALMRVTGTGVGLLALAGVIAGSHGRMAAFQRTDAVVRIAWSARPERIEHCRRLSEEELAKQPAHMRTRVECEGTTARYRLEVRREGVLVDSVTVRGGGLRHDREVYLSREILVAPGAARLAVRFVRVDSSTAPGEEDRPPSAPSVRQDSTSTPFIADRAVREDDERRRRRAEAIPPVLSLDTVVTLASRQVILVTYDALLRRLVTKASGPTTRE
jgi:hypothetical protein